MGAMTNQAIDELLSRDLVGVLGVNRNGGAPQLVPIWFLYQDGLIWMMSVKRDPKVGNIKRDPRITLCVDDRKLPYKGVVIYGRAKLTEQGLQQRRGDIARKYLGKEQGDEYVKAPRPGGSVLIEMTPERIYSWDYGLGDRRD